MATSKNKSNDAKRRLEKKLWRLLDLLTKDDSEIDWVAMEDMQREQFIIGLSGLDSGVLDGYLNDGYKKDKI